MAIMKLFYFSIFTVLATWILLLIGGLVNPMGASLACPDWYFVPTCNGELFPEMTGGVLYEHGHRLWASMVGMLTLVLALWTWLNKTTDKVTRRLTLLAVFLVALQGVFGGVTVLLGLNAALSTIHLVTAMTFFCLLIYIAVRLRNPLPPSGRGQGEGRPSTLVLVAFFAVLLQILLGGMIRHVGAGLACGDDWLSCGPTFWPSWHLGQMHMLHRLVGYAVAALVFMTSVKTFREDGRMAIIPSALVIVQIGLGLATVATVRSVPLVVMHTGVGALLLASLLLLYLSRQLKHAPLGL